MAAYLPQSEDGLLRIHGFGPVKLERYGASLLEAVRGHAEAKELPDHTSALGPPTKARTSGPAKRSTALAATRELLDEGRSVAEIAEARAVSVNTVLNHLERLVGDGAAFDLSPSLPAPERTTRIREALTAAGAEALRPVRDRLGPAYSYEEIRIVRASLGPRTPDPPSPNDD